MSESLKKAVLTKSGCDFNIDGMKLFRFHVSSYADCFYTNKLPDSSGKYLSFILCSTGKIRIRLLNGQIISAHQQEIERAASAPQQQEQRRLPAQIRQVRL